MPQLQLVFIRQPEACQVRQVRLNLRPPLRSGSEVLHDFKSHILDVKKPFHSLFDVKMLLDRGDLVMERVDKFGDPGPLLYLVRETKSDISATSLRVTESQKIQCGERHFVGALDVSFRVVTSADDLP